MRRFVIAFVVLLIVGGVIGWLITRPPPSTENVLPQPQQTASKPERKPPVKPAKTVSATPEEPAPTVEPDPSIPNVQDVTDANWEDRLDEVLKHEKLNTDQQANLIADMIPKVSAQAQTELAQHLVNLASDDDYKKVANLLRSEKTSGSASSVILNDLFNRQDELKLPLILEVAKNENLPTKLEALEMLQQLTQEDFGTDWDKWQKAVDEIVKGK